MKVWLLHIGEDLPVDGPTRPYRYSYLADSLREAGHQVLRWSPTLRHNTKQFRFLTDKRVRPCDDYEIQFVHASGYRRSIGLRRLRSYRVLGRRFRELATNEARPDLIVAAIPSLEWAEAAVDFARQWAIPVVVDIRDRWPDVFANAFPAPCRPLAQFALTPFRRYAERACRGATALTAVSTSYLKWALNLAGRARQDWDLVVPLAYQPPSFSESTRQNRIAQLRNRGIDPARPICLFAGLFERSYDLETVVTVAQQLDSSRHSDVQFVLCGDGSKMRALQRKCVRLRNTHLLGWVDADLLDAVASVSAVGLCPYTADALQSLPNKPFEYMSRGLAVVSSLRGELAELLRLHGCGLTYRAGDPPSLLACLQRLFSDPKLLKSVRRNAYETWSQNYQSRDVYSAFVSHLASFVSDYHGASRPAALTLRAA